jgi:uncharacterized protein YeaO (DUF488 family)
MLKQARVEDIAKNRITKIHGHIVVVTHYYPRFLKRKLIDEYIKELAPTRELLTEFKETEKSEGDHDQGFEAMNYEAKFTLSESGLSELARLSTLAREKDVYLVCHCTVGQRCHRELLLLIAKEKFEAPIARVFHQYPVFQSRIEKHLQRPD